MPRSRAKIAEGTDMHAIERQLRAEGAAIIAGIDEAGRGPLAGPVVAAAVVFPPGARIDGVNDSKKLSAPERERLFDAISAVAMGVGVGLADAAEIDRVNILNATRLAAERALRQLPCLPDHLLLDALRLDRVSIPQTALVKGDARCFSIAAASIVAKVTRDRLMIRYHEEYPEYGFDGHKGYPTARHYGQIEAHGISTLHRRSFFEPGFFSAGPPRRSRTMTRLLEMASGPQCDRPRMQSEIRGLTGFLPDCELADLARALGLAGVEAT